MNRVTNIEHQEDNRGRLSAGWVFEIDAELFRLSVAFDIKTQ